MSILKGGEDILSKGDETYNTAFLGADLELDGSRRRDVCVLWLFLLCQKNLKLLNPFHRGFLSRSVVYLQNCSLS